MNLVIIFIAACLFQIVYNYQQCQCPKNHYFDQNSIVCQKYPTQTDKQDYVQNCEHYFLYMDNVLCQECKKGFHLYNNSCNTEQLIENCAEYKYIDNKEYGDFKSTVYCNKCDQDYINHQSSDQLCIPFPQQQDKYFVYGCVNYQSHKQQNNQIIIVCDQCDKKMFYDKINQKCMPNPTQKDDDDNFIENCDSYQMETQNQYLQKINQDLITQQQVHLLCNECKDNYLLINNKQQCFKIPQSEQDIDYIPECQEYHYLNGIGSLQCSKCNDQYAIPLCTPQPQNEDDSFVQNCLLYLQIQDFYICTQCDQGFKITKNACLKIDIEQDENCLEQSTDGNCLSCKDNYFYNFAKQIDNPNKNYIKCFQCPNIQMDQTYSLQDHNEERELEDNLNNAQTINQQIYLCLVSIILIGLF